MIVFLIVALSIIAGERNLKDLEIESSNIQVVCNIGKGAFGQVQKCCWNGNPFAMKTVLSETVEEDILEPKESRVNKIMKAVNDPKNELEIVLSLNHENIIKFDAYWKSVADCDTVDDVFITNNCYNFLMELCDSDAAVFFSKKEIYELSFEKQRELLKSFVSQILNAVVYIHAKGISHLDIKPANILVKMENEKPIFKLADFGIATRDEETSAKGTAKYFPVDMYSSWVEHKFLKHVLKIIKDMKKCHTQCPAKLRIKHRNSIVEFLKIISNFDSLNENVYINPIKQLIAEEQDNGQFFAKLDKMISPRKSLWLSRATYLESIKYESKSVDIYELGKSILYIANALDEKLPIKPFLKLHPEEDAVLAYCFHEGTAKEPTDNSFETSKIESFKTDLEFQNLINHMLNCNSLRRPTALDLSNSEWLIQ